MDVFGYSNYRSFLRDWLENAKKNRSSSARSLAESIRIHPTFLSQVLLGKKEFSAEHWMDLCEKFDLTDIEKEYLHFTFLSNRAGNQTTKKFYQTKVDEILARRLQLKERLEDYRDLTDTDRAIFYSSWLYSAVRLYSAIGSGKTVEELAEKFDLNKDRTQQIVDFLLRVGLCLQRQGKIGIGDAHVHVPAGSPFVTKHHLNWRICSLQALDKIGDEEIHFTAPMAISKKDFSIIREKIVKLIQECVEVAKVSPAEDLAALTLDFYWPAKT